MKITNKTEATLINKPYSDIFVVNSARVSFSKESDFDANGNLSIGDQGLLNYLAREEHWCYDDKTEVLTINGWKNFTDITLTDKVAQVSGWDNNDFVITFVVPQEIHSTFYEGEMYAYDSNVLSYCVTPHHKMLYKKRSQNGLDNKWIIGNSDVIYGKTKTFRTTASVVDDNNTTEYNTGLLIGFMLGDGFNKKNNTENMYCRLKVERKIDFLTSLLDNMQITYSKKVGNDGVTNFTINHFINLYKDGVKYFDNTNIIERGYSFCKGVYYGLLESDGSKKRNTYTFSNNSRSVIELLKIVSTITGNNFIEGKCNDKERVNSTYRGTIQTRNTVTVNSSKSNEKEEIVQYSGYVSCVTVPTGMLLVRRNGKQMVCGNTPFSHVRETFILNDIDVEWLLTTLDPTNLAGMVINKVMYNNNSYWAIRHSLFGWIRLLKLNLDEYIFQPTQSKYIYQTLKTLYAGSVAAFAKSFDFSQYESGEDATDNEVKHVPNILVKDTNGDYVYKLFNTKTVSNFVDLTIREIVPVYVARQRFKHAIGFCVAKDTNIYMSVGKTNKLKKTTIEKLYNRLHKTAHHSRTTNLNYHRDAVLNTDFRVYDTTTKKFTTSKILDVIYSGKKPLYKITIENGYSVTVTEDHQLLTENGWDTLKNIVGLELTKNNVATMSKIGYVACNGVKYAGSGEYQNKEWLIDMKDNGMSVAQMAESAQCSYHTIRKWLKIHSLQFNSLDNLSGVNGKPSWNKGKFGYTNNIVITEEHKQKIRDARSGEKSNFWKGGVTTDRQNIGRWTREQSKKVFTRDNFTCKNCNEKNSKLHAHHIIPVYADINKAKDFDNLITLCSQCHSHIHSNNLESDFAKNMHVHIENWDKKTKGIGNTLTAKYNKILKVEYVGVDDVYDLTIEHESHNFIGNGVILHNCFNESSRRYVDFEPEYFVPDVLRGRAENKKQGSTDTECFEHDIALATYMDTIKLANENYLALVDKDGTYKTCPEQARAILPQAMMTDYYATGSYAAWKRLEYLRLDSHSQLEIQHHAQKINMITSQFDSDVNDYIANCSITINFGTE